MLFTYSEWKKICQDLSDSGRISVTARSVREMSLQGHSQTSGFLNIKHDVESRPRKALELARIEAEYGHKATYYVRPYLMTDLNFPIFDEIQRLGHEVSYHHEVIDLACGDLNQAVLIYEKQVEQFENHGFKIVTVCQHGNPASEFDNRDFFRSDIVQKRFPMHSDIMVDFMKKSGVEYVYISDVGMDFKVVTDPMNIHDVHSESKYIFIGDIEQVLNYLKVNVRGAVIISSHPHRYCSSAFEACVRRTIFLSVKTIARALFRIPGLKKFVFKFDFLTKFI